MKQNTNKIIYDTSALIFEQLGFMFSDENLDDHQKEAEEEAIVRLDFKGPFDGTLLIRICGGLLPTLAANMLGEDDEPSLAMQHDALGEIANEICGNLLPAVADKKDVFYLGAPVSIDIGRWQEITASRRPAGETHVGMEQGRADIVLYIDETVESVAHP